MTSWGDEFDISLWLPPAETLIDILLPAAGSGARNVFSTAKPWSGLLSGGGRTQSQATDSPGAPTAVPGGGHRLSSGGRQRYSSEPGHNSV